MSRPVPIVPEVLLLGTLPNPGDLERSIRLQLTPGSGPAPEMAMAAAGAPGRAVRLRGPGGRLRGSGLDIGGGLVVSDPSTGLSADVRVRVRVLLAKPPGSGNEGVSVSLSYSDARSTQPSPHGLAAGGGLADAPSAPPSRRNRTPNIGVPSARAVFRTRRSMTIEEGMHGRGAKCGRHQGADCVAGDGRREEPRDACNAPSRPVGHIAGALGPPKGRRKNRFRFHHMGSMV